MKDCYSCQYYKPERYNEKNICEYDYQVNNGVAVHIPKDKGELCNKHKPKT